MRISQKIGNKYVILGVFALGLGYYGYHSALPARGAPPRLLWLRRLDRRSGQVCCHEAGAASGIR